MRRLSLLGRQLLFARVRAKNSEGSDRLLRFFVQPGTAASDFSHSKVIYSSFPQILQSPSASDSFLKKLVHTELWRERQFTSRSPCQSPVLQNSLKLQTLGDLRLQVHHLIQQVLELQVIGIHFLLGLQGRQGQRGVGQGEVGQGKAQPAANSEKGKGD